MNLGDIPILGQAENKEKRIKGLEQELKILNSQAARLIHELRDQNLALITALRWFLKGRPEMRARIGIKEFDGLAKSHNLVLRSYLDKQTDDLVFYIDDKGVKEDGKVQETDKGTEAAVDKSPKKNG